MLPKRSAVHATAQLIARLNDEHLHDPLVTDQHARRRNARDASAEHEHPFMSQPVVTRVLIRVGARPGAKDRDRHTGTGYGNAATKLEEIKIAIIAQRAVARI